MQFNNHQSIYVQIAALMEEEIASGRWMEEARIPSVRELGMQLEVNPNTVMRSYEMVQEDQLIYNKRGLGYFVQAGAREAKSAEADSVSATGRLPRQAGRLRRRPGIDEDRRSRR